MHTSTNSGRVLTLSLLAAAVVALTVSPAFAQRWGRERFPDSGACFFRDVEFRGDYFCVRAGDDVGRMPEGMNDAISSIRVFALAAIAAIASAICQTLTVDVMASATTDKAIAGSPATRLTA